MNSNRSPPQQATPWAIPPHVRAIYNVPADLEYLSCSFFLPPSSLVAQLCTYFIFRATNPQTTQAAVEFEWPGCFNFSDIQMFQNLIQVHSSLCHSRIHSIHPGSIPQCNSNHSS